MAKKSKIRKNELRKKRVEQYAERRAALKKIISDPDASLDDKFAARDKLNAMPVDGSPVRVRSRGMTTGRPRGVFSQFGLDRVTFRTKALNGELPGIRKASW